MSGRSGLRRVPKDRPLEDWLRELIRAGKEQQFYQTKEWKELRAEILREHPLCEDCLKESPAKFTRAQYVHHVNEVKDRPDLALSMYVLPMVVVLAMSEDKKEEVRNLVALCFWCHEKRHGRFVAGVRRTRREQITEERFD